MIRKLLKKILGENFNQNNANLAGVNFGIILLMFLFSGIMIFFLPEEIQILHNGATEYPIPTKLGVWLFPMVALIVNISFIWQNRLTKMNSIIFVVLFVIMAVFYIRACLM